LIINPVLPAPTGSPDW